MNYHVSIDPIVAPASDQDGSTSVVKDVSLDSRSTGHVIQIHGLEHVRKRHQEAWEKAKRRQEAGSTASITAEELLEEARRMARPAVLLMEEGSEYAAVWKGTGVVPPPDGEWEHWISFDAGFLYAWLARRPLTECLRWGSACGSLSARGPGGTGHQADPAEVERLLSEPS